MGKRSKRRNIIKLIGWPILFGIGQVLIIGFLFLIMQWLKPISYTDFELQDRLRTILFPATLCNFVLFFPIFLRKYHKQEIHGFYLRKNKILYYILFGIVTSFIINIFFLKLERIIPIKATLNQMEVTYDWYYVGRVISTAFIGPVLEELLFRGFLYQEAKKWMKPMSAILFITVIFTLCHSTIYSICTAIVTSFLVLDALEKEKSLTAPILFHVFLNLTSILLVPLIVRYQTIYLDVLFIILLICFAVLYHSAKWNVEKK